MYNYQTWRDYTLTTEGQNKTMDILEGMRKIWNIYKSLPFKYDHGIEMREAIYGYGGLNYENMACVDRLVELGRIRKINDKYYF